MCNLLTNLMIMITGKDGKEMMAMLRNDDETKYHHQALVSHYRPETPYQGSGK